MNTLDFFSTLPSLRYHGSSSQNIVNDSLTCDSNWVNHEAYQAYCTGLCAKAEALYHQPVDRVSYEDYALRYCDSDIISTSNASAQKSDKRKQEQRQRTSQGLDGMVVTTQTHADSPSLSAAAKHREERFSRVVSSNIQAKDNSDCYHSAHARSQTNHLKSFSTVEDCYFHCNLPNLRTRKKEILRELVRQNPAAFSEEAALESESCFQAAIEIARRNFEQLTRCPGSPRCTQQFLNSIDYLRRQRPYFIAPNLHSNSLHPTKSEASRRKLVEEWDVDRSIFAQRKKENESRSLYDSDKALAKQFDLDWERIASKSRFRRLVSREDAGVRKNDHDLTEELNEIKTELKDKSSILRTAFIFYSMRNGPASSSNIFQLSQNQWIAFATECSILDAKSVGVKLADLVRMFVSTNFEEDSKTEESEANNDDALVRFEFLEILVRASFGKYMSSKQLQDSSDSVRKLLEDDVIPSLPNEATIDPNSFRREHLYTEQMDEIIKENHDFLLAIFKLYKAKDKTRYMSIEHWMTFLESTALLGPHTGIEKWQAKLAFAWCRLAAIDELKRRHRVVSLLFFDFLEALARIAQMISPPSDEEMSQLLPDVAKAKGHSIIYSYYSHMRTKRQGTAMSIELKSREPPVHESVKRVVIYLVDALKSAWGGNTKEQLTEKMRRQATKLNGGIELG